MLVDCVSVGTTVCVCAVGVRLLQCEVLLYCVQIFCEVLQLLLSAPKVGNAGGLCVRGYCMWAVVCGCYCARCCVVCAQTSCEVLQLLSAPKVAACGGCVMCVLCARPGKIHSSAATNAVDSCVTY
jgi:hypothetical protein